MHSGNRNWDCIKILKIAPIGFDVGIIIKMKDLKDRIGWCWSREKSVCEFGSRKKGPCFFYVGFKFSLGLPFGFDFAKPSDFYIFGLPLRFACT